MDAPEPDQTPFAAVTVHTTKLQRVRRDPRRIRDETSSNESIGANSRIAIPSSA